MKLLMRLLEFLIGGIITATIAGLLLLLVTKWRGTQDEATHCGRSSVVESPERGDFIGESEEVELVRI